jgi:hypothetical protein
MYWPSIKKELRDIIGHDVFDSDLIAWSGNKNYFHHWVDLVFPNRWYPPLGLLKLTCTEGNYIEYGSLVRQYLLNSQNENLFGYVLVLNGERLFCNDSENYNELFGNLGLTKKQLQDTIKSRKLLSMTEIQAERILHV